MDNAKYIDMWNIQVGRGEQRNKGPEWNAAMSKIRRAHICVRCHKYPGDSEFSFGTKSNCGAYTCFDCL